jgi:hypothetical protein
VQKIDVAGIQLSFEAEISCTKCRRKRAFMQTLKNLLNIKKLEIKLTGISVER